MEIVVEENPREDAGRKEKQNAYEEWVYKEWVNSIRRKIPSSSSKPFIPRPTIFRVPEHIRGGNENAYEPQVVSIGPYHRAREKFVDEHKWRYVEAILQRNPKKSLEDYLNGIKELEDRARSCYRETTEIQKIESNDFVEMMFVDGCFLVELFLKRLDPKKDTGHQDDIIYSDQLLACYLEWDLCLLENQLPFFILECIFQSVMSNQVNHLTTYFVFFGGFRFFKKILSSDEGNRSSLRSALLASLATTFMPRGFHNNIRSHVAVGEKVSFHHLLHLFHYSLSPDPDIHSKKRSIFQKLKNVIPSIFSRLYSHGSASSVGEIREQLRSMFKKLKSVIPSMFWRLSSHGSASSSSETALQLWSPSMFEKLKVGIRSIFPCLHYRKNHEQLCSVPSVTKLDDAGVNFRRAKNPGSILNIKFECGVMKIPYLFIDDSTNLFFRNLIAFEQCHQGVPQYFSEYAALMDFLINTRKDIEILSQNGIIEHGLGSDKEVALLFNRLGKGILVNFDDPYLSILFKEVTNYYSNCWPRSRATLCRDYFSSPWATLSVAAAFILLLLTAIQTFCSVFPR